MRNQATPSRKWCKEKKKRQKLYGYLANGYEKRLDINLPLTPVTLDTKKKNHQVVGLVCQTQPLVRVEFEKNQIRIDSI